ncbi:MAG: ankyrin repeat domain-containing protein [Hyphomicrobiales bacterium]|nr:ankyrin repeat domain-containing protein [Hyphomicrobiales bacterium]
MTHPISFRLRVLGASSPLRCIALCAVLTGAALSGVSAQPLERAEAVNLSPDQRVWHALSLQDKSWLRQLINDGANINAAEPLSKMTPIMAVDSYAIALELLHGGANVTARDVFGRTALHYAVEAKDAARIVPLLMQRGADANARSHDPSGVTPLIAAAEHYFERADKDAGLDVVRALIAGGASPNLAGGDGVTPLSIAAARGDVRLVNLLVELGADPDAGAENGKSLIDGANERGETEIAAALIRGRSLKRQR